jgi:TnpA family transposase
VDPTDEELARYWTLSEADKEQVRQCRGDAYRRSFALQLCVLRRYGRFLVEYEQVPVRILNHLSHQLDLPPVLFIVPPRREATDLDHERRIRDHLGFRAFDSAAQERVEQWLTARATEGATTAELLRRAEEVLHAWKIVLPGPSVLERLVASVATRVHNDVLEQIAARLPPAFCQMIDDLLQVPEGDQRSTLFHLKAYPPVASAKALTEWIERYHILCGLGIDQIDLNALPSTQIHTLAHLADRYNVRALKRFAPAKRYALVASFLVESQRTVLDYVVTMHDQFVTTMTRKARHWFEARYRELRQQAKQGLETVLTAIELLLGTEAPPLIGLSELYHQIDERTLREARDHCRAFQHLEESGYVTLLCRQYSHLRRYLPAFFSLPFQGERGAGPLLEGLRVARALDTEARRDLTADAPLQFVPAAWRATLLHADGTLHRRVWEIALAQAVRDALRSGDLYLPESRRHVSFWNLVYDEQRWQRERDHAYRALALPTQADHALVRLAHEFDAAARQLRDGLPQNDFAAIQDGRLHLKRLDALEIPPSVRELRRVLETRLPRIRIEDLLLHVNAWCGFTTAFEPLRDSQQRSADLVVTLLAALIAHGTNLGIAAMGHSAEGISVDMLQHVTHWLLREDTLKAANRILVDYHHQLALSTVWGPGTASSSDGQRFGLQADALLASFYPRYFGYYDRAVTVYTHVSDQYSVFSTRVISCAPREALYVLDGLLENDTVLRLREHYTDTHGYTEHIFGLCYLLGYAFMPRIRDLKDQQLYTVDRTSTYGPVDALFRGSIDLDLIREQCDALVRVAASLRNRTAPAHVVVQRLAGRSPADRLAKALTALGRAVKTIYILRYLHDESGRRRVQLQLTRGESRHSVARWLFFANQGEFRTGDYEEIMNKATCLSLLSNAVLVWNTVQIATIVEQLRAQGETVREEDLARISPLLHSHVIPNGTYHFRQSLQRAGVNIAPNTLP